MGNKFLLLVTIFLLSFPGIQFNASGQNMFEVDKEGDVSANITNASLQEVLKNFCSAFNLEVKGATASDETISLSITKGTFDETLKRLMRGYNYVLMQDATLDKLALIVLGKAERRKYVEEPPPARAPAEQPLQAPIITPSGQRGLASSPQPAPRSGHGNASLPNPTTMEPQRQLDEERIGSAVASAGAAHAQSPTGSTGSTGSTTPPAPPSIAGLELPPAPPTLAQARGVQPNASEGPPQIPGENSSGQTSLQTPPEIPTTSSHTQQDPKPTVNLKDLTPPPIPF